MRVRVRARQGCWYAGHSHHTTGLPQPWMHHGVAWVAQAKVEVEGGEQRGWGRGRDLAWSVGRLPGWSSRADQLAQGSAGGGVGPRR